MNIKNGLCLLLAVLTATSCVNSIDNDLDEAETEPSKAPLAFRVHSYVQEPMMRAALGDAFSTLEYRRISDGKVAQNITQTSSQKDFGVLQDVVPYAHHTFYFVGHSSTVTDFSTNGIVNFAKVTDTFSHKLEMDVSKDTPIEQPILLRRNTAKFELLALDALPMDLKEVELVIESAATSLNVSTGKGSDLTTQRKTIVVPTANLGLKNGKFIAYLFLPADKGEVTITATAKSNTGSVIRTERFERVPMQVNYITRYKGNLFSGTSHFSVSVQAEWGGTTETEF